jgi:hypothetical protein
MSTHKQPPEPDPDPAVVTSAALRHLVELARSQPVPKHRRDAAALHVAFLVARQARRRRVGAYVGLALAAALAALVVARLDLFADTKDMSIRTGPIDHVAEDMHPRPVEIPLAPPAPILTAAARVIADSDATPSPTVLGAWEVALAPGRYNIEVDEHPGAEALLLRAPGGALELHHGRVLMIVGASHTEVALQTGVGVWVAADGRRDALSPAPALAPSTAAPAPSTASPPPTSAPSPATPRSCSPPASATPRSSSSRRSSPGTRSTRPPAPRSSTSRRCSAPSAASTSPAAPTASTSPATPASCSSPTRSRRRWCASETAVAAAV